jgi:DNA adenine methylase
VYLDPPYHPTDEVSFTKYTKENFMEHDQVRLRNFIVDLTQKGVFVMLSNSTTRFIKELYASRDFHHFTVRAPRNINCKPHLREDVQELLITNYPIDG